MSSTTQTTQPTIFGLPAVAEQKRVAHGLIVHALHKSASIFLYSFFRDLCSRRKVPFYSIHNESTNLRTIPINIDSTFVAGPVRSFKTADFQFPHMNCVTHLVQVRDPRDILVSAYYSLGWIHSDVHWSDAEKRLRRRIQDTSIDQYAIREADFSKQSLLDRYSPILELANQPNVIIVRYEDMVLGFRNWLEPVLTAARVRPHSRWRSRLQRQYRTEFRPGGTNDPHKRNVIPGDHRIKLMPETILQLNRRFAPILECLGYE